MKKIILLSLFVLFLLVLVFWKSNAGEIFSQENKQSWWQYQIIDTMKFSRDPSREKLHDVSFDKVINEQVAKIAATGATHVAIATPYDEEFIPILQKWVLAARKNGLGIWFRGNFSGWEGWFSYPKISREEHLEKTVAFINQHSDLFQNGDIFSPCPECENGGPGDPRRTGDIKGHRLFLIKEYQAMVSEFAKKSLKVTTNFNSMNLDVAKLIMDQYTTQQLGGLVVIDHYVKTPEQLESDIVELAQKSRGKIVLGEFGAPIPDIHGPLTELEQAQWIEESLRRIASIKEFLGLNYWVNVGGSTAIWQNDGQPKKAVEVLTKYFQPAIIRGKVNNTFRNPIKNAKVTYGIKEVFTDDRGSFALPILETGNTLKVSISGYRELSYPVESSDTELSLVLEKEQQSILENFLLFLLNLFP
ncbi:carboxypeptidase regulatory-like domain-containing protein [Candidatus Microgenomates bacterium]|nr:carboxypeptidase regulatory-like domain-containing protein [Candidatus Microgenomates bacterium]